MPINLRFSLILLFIGTYALPAKGQHFFKEQQKMKLDNTEIQDFNQFGKSMARSGNWLVAQVYFGVSPQLICSYYDEIKKQFVRTQLIKPDTLSTFKQFAEQLKMTDSVLVASSVEYNSLSIENIYRFSIYKLSANGTWILKQKIRIAHGSDLIAPFSFELVGNEIVIGIADVSGPRIFHYVEDTSGIWIEKQIILPPLEVEASLFGHSVVFNDGNLFVSAPELNRSCMHWYTRENPNQQWSYYKSVQSIQGDTGNWTEYQMDLSNRYLLIGARKQENRPELIDLNSETHQVLNFDFGFEYDLADLLIQDSFIFVLTQFNTYTNLFGYDYRGSLSIFKMLVDSPEHFQTILDPFGFSGYGGRSINYSEGFLLMGTPGYPQFIEGRGYFISGSIWLYSMAPCNSAPDTIRLHGCHSIYYKYNAKRYFQSDTLQVYSELCQPCHQYSIVELNVGQYSALKTIDTTFCGTYTSKIDGWSSISDFERSWTTQNITGCDSSVKVRGHSLNPGISVYKDKNSVLRTTETEDSLSYQWIDCITNLPIPGATSDYFKAEHNGFYALDFSNDVCQIRSTCFHISDNEILKGQNRRFSVYPNPSTGTFHIWLDTFVQIARFKLYTSEGVLLKEWRELDGEHFVYHWNLSPNVYLLEIGVEDKVRTLRLVII